MISGCGFVSWSDEAALRGDCFSDGVDDEACGLFGQTDGFKALAEEGATVETVWTVASEDEALLDVTETCEDVAADVPVVAVDVVGLWWDGILIGNIEVPHMIDIAEVVAAVIARSG